MRRIVPIVMASSAALLIAGCSSLGASSHSDTSLSGARHPDCKEQGLSVASYLATGNPASMDLQWGEVRQNILSLPGQSRALAIRQRGDAVIKQCDQQAAYAAQQAWYAELAPQCTAIGGQELGSSCGQVPYYGSDGSIYYDGLRAPEGSKSFAPDSSPALGASATAAECAAGYYPNHSGGPWHGPAGHFAYGLCLAGWSGEPH